MSKPRWNSLVLTLWAFQISRLPALTSCNNATSSALADACMAACSAGTAGCWNQAISPPTRQGHYDQGSTGVRRYFTNDSCGLPLRICHFSKSDRWTAIAWAFSSLVYLSVPHQSARSPGDGNSIHQCLLSGREALLAVPIRFARRRRELLSQVPAVPR